MSENNNTCTEQGRSIPNHWQIKKLGEVAEINPKIPNKENISDEFEVQFLPMKLVEEINGKIHLTETRKYGEVKKGYTPFINDDVIFAKVTPCMENGKIAVVNNLKNEIGAGSSEFHVIRASNRILSKYIFYFIIQDKFRNEAANEMTGAVGLRRVPKQFIENYFIPIPPLPEQQLIVSRIEELLSDLENGKQQLLTAQLQLKVYRQSLLKWAFEGKLTNKNLKEGELPKGWKWVKLNDVSSKITDGEHITPRRTSEGYLLLSARNIQNGYLSLDDVDHIPIDEYERIIKRCNPEHGDILISCSGSIGRVCRVPLNLKFTMVRSVALVKLNWVKYSSKFYEYLFQSPLLQRQIEKSKKATAQANLFLGPIKNLDIIICPLEEQQLIVSELESKLTVCDKIEETISKSLLQAESLRQSILKKAFSGELVKNHVNPKIK